MCFAEEPEGFIEMYQSNAERMSEQLYGMVQLRVGKLGWKWQRKNGKEKLDCHEEASW